MDDTMSGARSTPNHCSSDGTVYAHSVAELPQEKWETLVEHSAVVAELAARFADSFGARDWGELLGQWHDLGKRSAEFQRYIRNGDSDAGEELAKPGRVDHSTYGARYASSQFAGKAAGEIRLPGQILAACIAGHHAGLADLSPMNVRGTLGIRLNPLLTAIPPVSPPVDDGAVPRLTFPFSIDTARPAHAGFELSFFARMLFSCLIDADRIATERFCDPKQADERALHRPTLSELRMRIDAHLEGIETKAGATAVNVHRRAVLAECLAMASNLPGFFSLNVPTGGGKTLASLAFALHHATANEKLRRIVVAIPFTSIIEQTADVYRGALGDLADAGLIEHHSNLNPKHDTRQNKLSSENWAAPLVVTTNVQLLESLFAARTTPARKLHRLANSVIILDEAQMLPVDLLAPTLAALRELVSHYGCTVVLCTATQPALEHRAIDFEIGIKNVKPIIADADALHASLKRVVVERLGKLDDVALVGRLSVETQVLCVVNTKAHASQLFDGLTKKLGERKGCFHLSTFMCPQHRRKVIAKIKAALKAKLPCRVISTQLIEAGVDLDFPCVYRAQAGFDSIAQAAGRCNREGKLRDANGKPTLGRVYVFDAEIKPPPGILRSGAATAAEIADQFPDPLSPVAVLAYFKQFYWSQRRAKEWDLHDVLQCFEFNSAVGPHRMLAPLNFRTAADAYRIIQDEQTPVVVPYNEDARRLIDYLRTGLPLDYHHYKVLQQYSVGVRDRALQQLQSNSAVMEHPAGVWFLPDPQNYSLKKGMLADAVGLGAEALIV
jgi:CRISPR-associated endonuclease/helicase Cas3